MEAPRRLVDWPWVVVEVECSLCSRHGRYRLARLAERFGAEVPLGRLLERLAQGCGLLKTGEKPRQYEARCGARYRLPAGGPMPEGAPARATPEGGDPRGKTRLGSEGPLPTIADTRKHGITVMRVLCLGSRQGVACLHEGGVALDRLGLPDDAVFVHIPRLKRLRCGRCGSHEAQVQPLWPDVRMRHAARLGVDTRPRMPGTVPEFRMPGLGETQGSLSAAGTYTIS